MIQHLAYFRWHQLFKKLVLEHFKMPNYLVPSLKIMILTPAIILSIDSIEYALPGFIVLSLYLFYGLLDYADVIRHEKGDQPSRLIYAYQRLVDYPLVIALGYIIFDKISFELILLKIVLDGILILIQLVRDERHKTKIPSGVNFVTMLIVLMVAVNSSSKFVTPALAEGMLIVSIILTLIQIGSVLGILKKNFIADALSLGNLVCGLIAIFMATKGRIDLSLLFIGLGAAFDGLDGAAARKFGSTKWGVYSDDIADGITYGIAPGIITMIHFQQFDAQISGLSLDGYIIGGAYVFFTLGRLVYFTLNKANSDPEYFMGAPSVFGGTLVVSSVFLFSEHYALLGMMIGVACVLMVTFDSHYRHMGRLIGSRQSMRIFSLIAVLMIITLGFFKLTYWAIMSIFIFCMAYGFLPMLMNFQKVLLKDEKK